MAGTHVAEKCGHVETGSRGTSKKGGGGGRIRRFLLSRLRISFLCHELKLRPMTSIGSLLQRIGFSTNIANQSPMWC